MKPLSILFVLAAIMLPQLAIASVEGDVQSIPVDPSAHTIVVVPDNFQGDPAAQELLSAFATDPTLVALRQMTQVQTYTASDPDYKHRFAKRMPKISAGNSAVLVVQGEQLLYGRAGATPKQLIADIKGKKILASIDCAASCRFFRPKEETVAPSPPEDNAPLRPILPPIAPMPVEPPPAVLTDDTDMVMLALSAVAGGFVGWAFMFNRKVSKK